METVFEAIRRAHGQLARKRVLGDIRVLARDTQDMVKTAARELRETFPSAACLSAAIKKHLYEYLGTAIGLGMLVGLVIGRRRP